DLPEQPVDKTIPKYKQIDKRAGPYVQEWAAELRKVHADTGLDKHDERQTSTLTKRSAPTEDADVKDYGPPSKAKRAKREDDSSVPPATKKEADYSAEIEEVKDAWETGNLSKCKVATLRAFLASEGIRVAEKKAQLVERVELMLGKSACLIASALSSPPSQLPSPHSFGVLEAAMTSLKQFIRNVRAAKTIADERSVVQKESAAIRASFREEHHTDSNLRRNNVAKLLYLFTLGERTHFGQIECLKLLASPRFADKRLGYLGTMLLLDENQEVLTLVTNSLKNDLNHSNQYVVGLALCTLGNITSVEMARDLFPEIESLVSTANPYIRRKAALCAMKICRKVPDLQEHFVDKIKALLSDRNHGVLLCGLTVAIEFCLADEEEGSTEVINQFRPLVPALVKALRSLTTAGYSPEHDVSGITDPFVQVKILRFFRVLGHGDSKTSEAINDILAQVATNTEASKNVGNAILYEAVLTILDIEADSGLRVLGVNILGKFLSNKDNNIRYVALNTLNKVVAVEPNAVQRHRNTILECLRDADISIRRRALDLSFTLINESNVRPLVRELLAFLEVADNEFKQSMTTQIGIAADRFAPTKRWHVDTMLRVLTLAGAYVREQILSSFVRLIATTPELQTYSVQKLYAALKEDISQEGLTLAASWVIGEYGDLLLKAGQNEGEELAAKVQESDIVDLFTNILNSTYATQLVVEYITTSAMKMTTRMTEPAQIERLRRLLSLRTTDLDVEIQQRAVEYTNLFGYDSIRFGVLERMPAPEIREEQRVLGAAATGTGMGSGRKVGRQLNNKTGRKQAVSKPAEQDLILDLMGGDEVASPVTPAQPAPQNSAQLLEDILGGGSSVPPVTNSPAPAPAQKTTASQDILGLFDSNPAPPATSPPTGLLGSTPSTPSLTSSLTGGTGAGSIPTHVAFNKNGLQMTFQIKRPVPNGAQLLAKFTNVGSAGETFSNVGLQVAVPKSQKLNLNPINKSDLAAGEEGIQQMKVQGVSGPLPPKLRLRLRISYSRGGEAPVTEQVDWSEP
ncbi:clathrin associated protein complex large subunit, partial [Ascosphaera pollenicola]